MSVARRRVSAPRLLASMIMVGALAAPAEASQLQAVPEEWNDISGDATTLSMLATAARAAVGDQDFWVGYTFPLRPDVSVGCRERRGRGITFGADEIRLHIERGDDDTDLKECDEDFGLFLRFAGDTSEVAEARMMTWRRAARRIEEPIVWAGEFSAADSVAFLRAAILGERGAISSNSETARQRLLSAVAVHDDRSAVEVVFAAVDPMQAADLRESAVFWVSQVGGDEGLQRLLDLARHDDDDEVRKQSIFWLGQVAGERATADLADIAEDDPNTEVRLSAVFALSQSGDAAAVDALIRIVRSHDNREVVKSALLWLGQSGDPRAIELFEQLIFGGR